MKHVVLTNKIKRDAFEAIMKLPLRNSDDMNKGGARVTFITPEREYTVTMCMADIQEFIPALATLIKKTNSSDDNAPKGINLRYTVV